MWATSYLAFDSSFEDLHFERFAETFAFDSVQASFHDDHFRSFVFYALAIADVEVTFPHVRAEIGDYLALKEVLAVYNLSDCKYLCQKHLSRALPFSLVLEAY